MTWVRFDDDFASHRKVRRLSDASFRFHVSAVCWASKYLTDGYISRDDAEMLVEYLDEARDPVVLEDVLAELVARGVWHLASHSCPRCPTSDRAGWVIHDYLETNPSAEQVRHKRQQDAERQRRARERGVTTNRAGDVGLRPDLSVSRRDGAVSHGGVMRESRLPVPSPTPTPIKEQTRSAESRKSVPETRSETRGESDGSPPKDPPEFARFWSAYPRREAKGAARTAWGKAITKARPEEIISAAVSYRDRMHNQEPRYVAHASTWLNQERWTDQPSISTSKPVNGHHPYRDNPAADYHAEL
jgi:hypothetical protein